MDNKFKIAILTVGAPGSGKSTYAFDFKSDNDEYVILERDILRKEVCEEFEILRNIRKDENFHTHYYSLHKDIIAEVEKEVTKRIEHTISTHDFIILSNTNLTTKHRNAMINNLKNRGFTVHIKIFNKDLPTLLKHNELRVDVVGQNVVFNMYQKLQHSMEEFRLDTKNNIEIIYDHNEYSKDSKITENCVICDIDGTIAHIEKNSKGYPNRTHFDMTKVFDDSFDDIVFSMVLGVLTTHKAKLVFFTGRTADCFVNTIRWLDKHLEKYNMSYSNGDYVLYSRAIGDYSKDFVIKSELYNTFVKNHFNVLAVFDDRPQVVQLWNDMRLKTIAVADQRIEF